MYSSANSSRTRASGAGFVAGLICGVAFSVLLVTCVRTSDKGAQGEKGGKEATQEGSSASVQQESKKARLDDLVVARVGKRKITPKDIQAKMRVQFAAMLSLTGPDAMRQRYEILRSMVDQYSWVEAGERNHFDKDEDFVETLELSRKFILTNHTTDKLVYQKAQATDDEIRAFYEDNLDQFRVVAQVDVSHILTAQRAEAEQLRRRAAGGEDFAALATKYSIDPASRDVQGRLGTITARSGVRGFGDQPSEINSTLMAMPAGAISAPIRSARGWSLFQITAKREETVEPLDKMREVIKKKLDAKKANELYSSVLAGVRKEAGAEIDDNAWMKFAISNLTDDEVFSYVQTDKNPRNRIAAYEVFAAQSPDSPRAPQALFMAGFIWADELRDYPKAKEIFQRLMSKYPQNELIPSAKWMTENMEKGLENLPYAEQLKQKAAAMGSSPR